MLNGCGERLGRGGDLGCSRFGWAGFWWANFGRTIFARMICGWTICGASPRRSFCGGYGGLAICGWGARIGEILLGRNLTAVQCGEIVGDGFLFVEADVAGVGADESFIEDAAGKLVEVFFFEGAEHAGADFCGVGNGIEFDAALFALFAKFFPERAQVVTPAGRGLRST